MKRIFTTMLVSMMTFAGVMAQMNIWYNGAVVYQRDYTLIDSITFTIQQPSQYPDLEEGMYLIGEATTIADLNAENIDFARMGQGTNEITKQYRQGMYEKYIYLEANKDFQFVLHELGKSDVTYGSNLVLTDIETDWQPTQGYTGNLLQNVSMQVPQSGLYHVIADFNLDGQLNATRVLVVPCEWYIRGTMNSWGYTPMEIVEQSATKVVYKYAPAVPDIIQTSGTFRFAHSDSWKLLLDMNGWVRAEVSIGTNATQDGGAYTELIHGGKTIPYTRGVYDYVTLTWELTGGKVCDGFSFEAHKSATLPVQDPSEFVAGISGEGLFGANGYIPVWTDPVKDALAVFDADASVITNQTTKAGTYVYNISNLNFEEGSRFKFRYNGGWLGVYDNMEIIGISPSGYDYFEGITGAYNIKFTVEWTGDDADYMRATSFKAEFTAGVPAAHDYVSGRILVQNLSDLTNLHLYGWALDYDNSTSIFGIWPGTAAGADVVIDNVTYKEFTYTKAIRNAAYKFIANGGLSSGQSSDPEWTVTITGADVKLRLNADRILEVIE